MSFVQIPYTLFIVSLVLEFLTFSNQSYAQDQLNYEELIKLGASCSPNDTCAGVGGINEKSLTSRKCECDIFCAKYSSCCIDSAHVLPLKSEGIELSSPADHGESCLISAKYPVPVFGINKCKQNFKGSSEVKTLCETGSNKRLEDPIAMLPVTNPITAVTYKNYFCALCNYVRDRDLVFWRISIKYPKEINQSALAEKIVYNNTRGKWGIWKNGPSHSSFETVSIFFHPEESLYDKLHRCDPTLVSTCHPDWNDDKVKRKCLAYMGRVSADVNNADDDYASSFVFKNIHCAICNFAQYEPKSLCEELTFEHRTPDLSFTMLLDINFSDGKRVGEVNPCKQGEIHDIFFKKCRAMLCVKPGYHIANGKCVP